MKEGVSMNKFIALANFHHMTRMLAISWKRRFWSGAVARSERIPEAWRCHWLEAADGGPEGER